MEESQIAVLEQAIETVAGLFADEFSNELNIDGAVKDFGLTKSNEFCDEVLKYLKERV